MTKTRFSFEEARKAFQAHGLEIEPPKRKPSKGDHWRTPLGKALRARAKTTKTAPAVETGSQIRRPKLVYVNDDGHEYLVGKGEWVARDLEYWERQARQPGFSKVLEVRDVSGPSVIDTAHHGRVIARGCIICGLRDVARPKTPMRFGKWRGAMCPDHHQAWEVLRVPERKQLGLFVARALYDADLLPGDYPTRPASFGVHPVDQYPSNWKSFTWGYRVLTSDHPEKQEPVSNPFGFLSPGPIPFAEGVT